MRNYQSQRNRLELHDQDFSMEHEMALSVLWNPAMCYPKSDRLEETEPRFKTSVDTKARILGRDDPEVLESLVQLAWVQQQL